LHHTNIVPAFGAGEQDGCHFYVMQYIEGVGLNVVLAELRRLLGYGLGSRPTARKDPSSDGGRHQPQPPRSPVVRGGLAVTAAGIARSLATGQFDTPGFAGSDGAADTPEGSETRLIPTPVVPQSPVPTASSSLELPGSPSLSARSGLNHPYFQSVARIGVQ